MKKRVYTVLSTEIMNIGLKHGTVHFNPYSAILLMVINKIRGLEIFNFHSLMFNKTKLKGIRVAHRLQSSMGTCLLACLHVVSVSQFACLRIFKC